MSPRILVSTEELASRVDDPRWVVFDCRFDLADPNKGAASYRASHIPGAHYASLDRDLAGAKTGTNGRHPLPDPRAFIGFLAAHGVGPSTQLVAYDDVGGQFAARLWWLARWVGHEQAALLDGGWNKWSQEVRPVSAEVPLPRPVTLAGEPEEARVRTADFILAHLHDARIRVIDARAPERYRGEIEPIDPVAGHIPGARNRFYKRNLRPDFTFRSASELRDEWQAELGGLPAENVVHQCGSGVTACANVFAMEYAGLPGSTLYPGSWSEWISDPKRPVARGA